MVVRRQSSASALVPDHRAGVVETLEAERLAEARVILGVHAAAGQARAVFADGRVASWPATPRPAVPAQGSRVHDAEAGRGEGDEQRRVFGHGVGDALATAEAVSPCAHARRPEQAARRRRRKRLQSTGLETPNVIAAT